MHGGLRACMRFSRPGRELIQKGQLVQGLNSANSWMPSTWLGCILLGRLDSTVEATFHPHTAAFETMVAMCIVKSVQLLSSFFLDDRQHLIRLKLLVVAALHTARIPFPACCRNGSCIWCIMSGPFMVLCLIGDRKATQIG